MDAENRGGLQDGLAQLVSWLLREFDHSRQLHDIATDEGRAWSLNRALLFMAAKGWQSYFHETGRTDADLIAALRADLAKLAALPEEQP